MLKADTAGKNVGLRRIPLRTAAKKGIIVETVQPALR